MDHLDKLADEVHKPKLKKFSRRKVYAKRVYEILGCDLVDLTFWSNENNGYKFILTVVDVLSKYALAYPLKSKSADDVTKAFEELFKHVIPEKLWFDEGKEFYNKKLAAVLKKHNIEFYSTHGDHKCAVIERFNRTLRGRMFKMFTKKNNRDWIHILNDLIKNYNNSKHSTIKMKPIEAIKKTNYDELSHNFNNKNPIIMNTAPKLKVGDYVRISRVKQLFEKGETRNWSLEIFKIKKVLKTMPVTYHIDEYDGSPIIGSFYEQELQKTDLTDTFLVEKVLKTRKHKGKNESFVKWLGWDDKYNSWIDSSDVVGDFE
jgi:IS30 family transposase